MTFAQATVSDFPPASRVRSFLRDIPQIATFCYRPELAEEVAAELRGKGYPVYLDDRGDGGLWVVIDTEEMELP